jgi:class 3 adenylate cyclase
MPTSTRDLLLELLERAASGKLVVTSGRSEHALLTALEAEGLIERRRGGFGATRVGIRALEDRGRAHGLSGAVTVVFTDVVGSTQLVDRLGDFDAHRVLQRHFGMLRAAIAEHSGHEVKSLGDGLMVVFEAAADAVESAAAMQSAVACEGDRLGLRIGIHAGEPLREGNDYFGTPVIVARRLCEAALAGQTLVSELVQGLAADHEFEPVGNVALKGMSLSMRASALVVRSLERAPTGAVAV